MKNNNNPQTKPHVALNFSGDDSKELPFTCRCGEDKTADSPRKNGAPKVISPPEDKLKLTELKGGEMQ